MCNSVLGSHDTPQDIFLKIFRLTSAKNISFQFIPEYLSCRIWLSRVILNFHLIIKINRYLVSKRLYIQIFSQVCGMKYVNKLPVSYRQQLNKQKIIFPIKKISLYPGRAWNITGTSYISFLIKIYYSYGRYL